MAEITKELLNKHLKTHCKRADEDRSAISVLNTFLRSDGKINTNFECNDTWPNTDGTFEFVSNPDMSKIPEQNFIVQVKGTAKYSIEDGTVKYLLPSLAFPAYILQEVTLDPGILFVVLNPTKRGQERVFWKYMSVEFLNSIDYNKNSCTISFSSSEEIKNTIESVNKFCDKLCKICRRHSFVKRLESREYFLSDIEKIVKRCSEDIEESIDRLDIYNDSRDDVSRRILSKLEDLCRTALIMNELKSGKSSVNLQLAWEKSLFDRKTVYLNNFLRMLKYIDYRVPDDGQSERLMLKYYNFMWQIREDFKTEGWSILSNLEKFPLKENIVDKSYYESVAKAIDAHRFNGAVLRKSRYYIEKETPFYVNGKRYYEITLQLAGIYATKFNRLTVYSLEFIPSNYSIRISYDELDFAIWDVDTKIKLITKWSVSIEPTCLNKLSKILKLDVKLSAKYGEYNALMAFFTKTGINLLDFIDCTQKYFDLAIDKIYAETKTDYYKKVLLRLRCDFNSDSRIVGKNTIRYLLVGMREESIASAFPAETSKLLQNESLYLSNKCYPFEKRPFISNFAGSKTSKYTIAKDVVRAVGYEQLNDMRPYLTIKKLIGDTGEIYFDENAINSDGVKCDINRFNSVLDTWEKDKGFLLKQEEGRIYIESFEKDTLSILECLLKFSKLSNKGQEALNKRYIKSHASELQDELKKQALTKLFVSSKIMLIYGAAGTGKTTLINHISNLVGGRRKLFLTKTHTALQNLQRTIENTGVESDFISIDSFTKKIKPQEYDIIFVDECSTIDNRTMANFFGKVKSDACLVLAGDIYQLESIDFGNWFEYAKELMPVSSKVELLNTWRTNQQSLKDLWNEVRMRGNLVREKLVMDGSFSEEINKNLLQKIDEDEVVLCLNYDGKFGLNNINAIFQANNKNEVFTWQEWSYKVGDPILFTESKRFPTVFYNNLKGRIVKIEKDDTSITFTVDINRVITENDCSDGIEFIENDEFMTRVRFMVYDNSSDESDENEEEKRLKSVVPFHLAYGVSIHKAQGLEYNSVKVIIPDSNAEKITHGIFYTAITRAKKNLKIYWSPETMTQILNSFEEKPSKRKSLEIIKKKLI